MKAEQIITQLKPGWKIVAYLASLFLAAVSVYCIYIGSVKAEYEVMDFLIIVLFVLVLIGSITSILYIHSYQVIIDESGIMKVGFFSNYTIPYSEIEKIVFDVMVINIYGNGRLVSLGNLYNNFDQATGFIAEQVKDREDITYKGKRKFFNMSLKSNRLYR